MVLRDQYFLKNVYIQRKQELSTSQHPTAQQTQAGGTHWELNLVYCTFRTKTVRLAQQQHLIMRMIEC